jgi:hypothetical protein
VTTLAELSEPVPDPGPADWNEDGVVILRRLIPDLLIERYQQVWVDDNGGPEFGFGAASACLTLEAERPGGWPDVAPYMRHAAVLNLFTFPLLAGALSALIGEPAGLHLNLTGWVSTERDWHQDGYLNPLEVGDSYAAVWVALGHIHADSGPFQYVPGSHRWHRLVRERFAPHLDLSHPQWPKRSEEILSPLVEAEIEARGATVESYLPQKGDVLIWHPRLYHRGSRANVPGAYRPAAIAHYSGIHHHSAMPEPARQVPGAGWFFPLHTDQPVA